MRHVAQQLVGQGLQQKRGSAEERTAAAALHRPRRPAAAHHRTSSTARCVGWCLVFASRLLLLCVGVDRVSTPRGGHRAACSGQQSMPSDMGMLTATQNTPPAGACIRAIPYTPMQLPTCRVVPTANRPFSHRLQGGGTAGRAEQHAAMPWPPSAPLRAACGVRCASHLVDRRALVGVNQRLVKGGLAGGRLVPHAVHQSLRRQRRRRRHAPAAPSAAAEGM